jgi:hypothetical protein
VGPFHSISRGKRRRPVSIWYKVTLKEIAKGSNRAIHTSGERLLPSDSLSAFLGQRTSKGESIRYWSVLDLNSFFW